jgi:hypothetical protein
MFQVGGTDVYLHKYVGPKNPTEENATADQPIYDEIKETNIQDLLLLENRDRKYDLDIYRIRGVYNVQDLDFNLSQFALFIDNDTVFMTVHINDFVKTIGRKPMSGDVIELPHLRDEFAFNNADISLPRYYVISDVGRASEGFTATWYPHLYRLKLTKIVAQQQFADIFNRPADDSINFRGDFDPQETYYPGEVVRYNGVLYTVTQTTTGVFPPDSEYFELFQGETLYQVLSSKTAELSINDAVLAQAEADAPLSGYQTDHFFTLAVDSNGKTKIVSTDNTDVHASSDEQNKLDASRVMDDPLRSGYTGYLLGDGVPSNGASFGSGINFPISAIEGDFFLRTDFLPNRLFRFDGKRWVKREDNVRHPLSNIDTRQTQKTAFINNTKINEIAGDAVEERQSLSKALRPKADL